MAQIIILGTAAAVASADRDYAHLAVQVEKAFILVDCGGSPMARLAQMELDWRQLSDVVVTHFHADHIAGLPNLIVGMWLSGRQEPLYIHGLKPTLQKLEHLLDLFDWKDWPGLFPIVFREIPDQERSLILDNHELRVFASPTAHSVPSVGLRFESKYSGKAAAYSSDTAPTENIARLAQDVRVLLHEATGNHPGHSTAQEAGEIARQANASHLYLIHYGSPLDASPGELIAEARRSFQGRVTLTQEGMRIIF